MGLWYRFVGSIYRLLPFLPFEYRVTFGWSWSSSRIVRRRGRHKEVKANTLIPLGKRKRSLTHRGDGRAVFGRKQRIGDQSKCALLSVLPAEIRTAIWRRVICGQGDVVHVFRDGTKMGYWRCSKLDGDGWPCKWGRPCSPVLPYMIRYAPPPTTMHHLPTSSGILNQRSYCAHQIRNNNRDWGVISMLQSCRQIYTEAIEMLYTQTHFHFPNATGSIFNRQLHYTRTLPPIPEVSLFCYSIPPSRVDCIRKISFDWTDENSSSQQLWETISEMQGLRELRIMCKCLDVKLKSEELRETVSGMQRLSGRGLRCEILVPPEQTEAWRTAVEGLGFVGVLRDEEWRVVRVERE